MLFPLVPCSLLGFILPRSGSRGVCSHPVCVKAALLCIILHSNWSAHFEEHAFSPTDDPSPSISSSLKHRHIIAIILFKLFLVGCKHFSQKCSFVFSLACVCFTVNTLHHSVLLCKIVSHNSDGSIIRVCVWAFRWRQGAIIWKTQRFMHVWERVWACVCKRERVVWATAVSEECVCVRECVYVCEVNSKWLQQDEELVCGSTMRR